MKNLFWDVVRARRSVYSIGKQETLSPAKLEALLKDAIALCPSAFDSQPARVALLLGKNHQRLWEIVWQALQKTAPPEALKNTKAKLDSFAAGAGTILFFIDDGVTKQLQEKNPLYAENFPAWAEQSTGMLIYLVWCALAEDNIGASLQHYNPLIDEMAAKEWGIPEGWRLMGQMVFGSIQAPPATKSEMATDGKLLVFNG